MAKKQTVPTHQILRLAIEAVGRRLAHTLAECLFWSQHSTKQIEGRPAIWKTGPELASILGMAPRTANRHLKDLAALGYWELTYRARGNHPSPATWLVFSVKSAELLAEAASETSALSKRPRKQAFDGPNNAQSKVSTTHVQVSQNVTSLQTKPAIQNSSGQKRSFLLTKEEKIVKMNEPSSYKFTGKKSNKFPTEKAQKHAVLDDGLIIAPKYIKASVKDRELLTDIRATLEGRDLPPWDTVSRFTWEHVKEIRLKLAKRGVASRKDQAAFFSATLEHWEWLRNCAEYRFFSHPSNRHRPTPMALAMQFKEIADPLFNKLNLAPTKKVSDGLIGSFDDF